MILVVEDDPDNGDMLVRALKRFGYDARSARSAGLALEALKQLPIRVAIIDYNLPDRDGLWLVAQMNADESLAGVRTVFLSGTFENDVARRAFAAGAADWLVKGVHSVNHVVETVQRLHGPS